MERACAVLEKGGLSCWGGTYRSAAPEVVPGVTEAIDVAVVGFTQEAFVVRRDGSLLRVAGTAVSAVPGFRTWFADTVAHCQAFGARPNRRSAARGAHAREHIDRTTVARSGSALRVECI
jgi:hypothetical protein